MEKCDPQELKDAAEDLQGWIHRHPDVVKTEPDIVKSVIAARDRAIERYQTVTEKKSRS